MSELITSYLNQSGNKSLYYFLRHYRDEIVATTPVTSFWKDLDNTWSTKFITGVGRLGEHLSRKVNQERVRYAKKFEDYWKDVINECKIKEDILVYEAEEARIQDELSRLRHQLSEIQGKVKMQNSSNREMDEDSVNEDPVHDGLMFNDDVDNMNNGNNNNNDNANNNNNVDNDNGDDDNNNNNNDNNNNDNNSNNNNNNNNNSIVGGSMKRKKRKQVNDNDNSSNSNNDDNDNNNDNDSNNDDNDDNNNNNSNNDNNGNSGNIINIAKDNNNNNNNNNNNDDNNTTISSPSATTTTVTTTTTPPPTPPPTYNLRSKRKKRIRL